MNNYKKASFSILIVAVMVLSSLMAIMPLTNAANSQSPAAPVGTVTLSPSSGAFPGQLVTFTWSGVPTNLVAPVYVTVYLNGSAYTTVQASYIGSTLMGSFLMPNDNPGTTFTVSFQYMDSAHNSGIVSTSSGSTQVALSATESSFNPANTTTNPVSSPYTVLGNTTYGKTAIENITSSSTMSTGSSSMTTNQTGVPITSKTKLYNDSTKQSFTFNGFTNFTGKEQLYGNSTQKVFMNATTFNNGQASLALPTPKLIYTTFVFGTNDVKSFNSSFYLNTTVEGTNVSIFFKGSYTVPFNAVPNTYTLVGSFNTIAPAALKNNLTGTFSSTYDISSFNSTKNEINYTLSITFSGSYTFPSGQTVSIFADYANSTVIHATGSGGKAVTGDSLDLQSGSHFTSSYVGLENPGISGSFVFKYANGALKTNNITFSFSNFYKGIMSTVPNPLYLTVKNVSVTGFNETVKGTLNLTIISGPYTQGVYGISAAIWNFSLNYSFVFTGTNIYLKGSAGPQSNNFMTNVSAPYGNFIENFSFATASNMTGMVGFLQLSSIIYGQDTFTLMYDNSIAPITVSKNATSESGISAELNRTSHVYTFSQKRSVSGFNESLNAGPTPVLKINATAIVPALYGVTSQGYVNFTFVYNGTFSDPSSNIIVYEQIGPSVGFSQTVFSNITYTVSSGSYAFASVSNFTASLSDFTGKINSAVFSATLNALFNEYSGSIVVSGTGGNKTVNTLIESGNAFEIAGNVTSLSGFSNDSMKGWFNATVTFGTTDYALYGISTFNGYSNYTMNIAIKKESSKYPFFIGYLNLTGSVPLTSKLTSGNSTSSGTYSSSYLRIEGNETPVEITGVSITGTFTVTDPVFGYTNTFAYSTSVFDINSSANGVSNTPSVSAMWVSGDQNMSVYSSPHLTVKSYVGAPFQNVTLKPLINNTVTADFYFANHSAVSSSYYYEDGPGYTPYFIYPVQITDTHVQPLNPVSNASDAYSSVATGFATQYVYQVFGFNVNLNTQIGNMIITTNSIQVTQAGKYFVTGIANGPEGSGTVTGFINAQTVFPSYYQNYTDGYYDGYYYGVNLNQSLLVSANLTINGYYDNGTQFYSTVTLPSTMIMLNAQAGYHAFYYYGDYGYAQMLPGVYNQMTLPGTYSMSNIGESANTGTVSFGSFSLVSGSGASVVTITPAQIAEIATQTGADINISLTQLNAKVSSVWSEQNNTYVTLNTDYGTMTAQLKALNANLTNVENGMVTIQTSLGTIQTTLSSIDAQITSVSGSIATLQTNVGTIQTSLNSLNATVASINGNVATIQTSLGTLSGTVTSINNGVATIQTNLGTLQTSVNGVNSKVGTVSSSVGNTMIFEVVVLILVLITLVLAFLAMNNSNKLAKKLDEMKKQ